MSFLMWYTGQEDKSGKKNKSVALVLQLGQSRLGWHTYLPPHQQSKWTWRPCNFLVSVGQDLCYIRRKFGLEIKASMSMQLCDMYLPMQDNIIWSQNALEVHLKHIFRVITGSFNQPCLHITVWWKHQRWRNGSVRLEGGPWDVLAPRMLCLLHM